MTRSEIRNLQLALNKFTGACLSGVGNLIVDGLDGVSTTKRVELAKFYLGYERPINVTVDHTFLLRIRFPKDPRYSSPIRIARGITRRTKQRSEWRSNKSRASRDHGVGAFDGKPVALWFIPHLQWARSHGWRGGLSSGWRDPVYSEKLCIRICGRPSCPGRCAGRTSNHVGSDKPKGAIDVSDYARFGTLMRSCPHQPKIYNALPNDPVHFSSTGR